jgi:DNA ligase-1
MQKFQGTKSGPLEFESVLSNNRTHCAHALLLMACSIMSMPSLATVADHAAAPVMLANVYPETLHDLSDYWVSEKYDGVRAYWNGTHLLSRAGNLIHAPQWFIDGLPRVPLDGELWVGRGQFEITSSIVRDVEARDADWKRVHFNVFDLPADTAPFTQRLTTLQHVIAQLGSPWVQLVVQYKVSDRTALDSRLHEIVAGGGEGLMLHRGSSHYSAGRSDDLLKFKPFDDAEARVIGYEPGKGKYEGQVGALRVQRADGVIFSIGTGLSDADRAHPPVVGSTVTYVYQGLTARGLPRFARLHRMHEGV